MRIVSLADVTAARDRISRVVRRTPLLRLEVPGDPREIWLKLENLQPIGSFKLRGAANAIRTADRGLLGGGVCTASAGNMAQGVAYVALQMGLQSTALVPDRAPTVKTDALERMGARVVRVPFDEWWAAMLDHGSPSLDGYFVHPFEDEAVMAGNGTIAAEMLEDVPGLDAIVVPWGGGGLACGVAAAARAIRPRTAVYPVEVETAAPLAASFALGRATRITPQPSFVDGMGGISVFDGMWPLAQELVQRPIVVTVEQIADAVRLVAERARVVAEGAGAATVAAALAALPDARKIGCVISGGNIDRAKLATILSGELPT